VTEIYRIEKTLRTIRLAVPVLVAVLTAGLVLVWLQARHTDSVVAQRQRAERSASSAQSGLQTAASQASAGKSLAQQIQGACTSGGAVAVQLGQACASASRVATQQVPPVAPMPAPAGRNIAGTELRTGDLWLLYTDGSRQDVGRVVGPSGASGRPGASGTPGRSGSPGSSGEPGQSGRGVAAASVDSVSGDLLLTYTDGATQDVGHVVGNQGANGTDGKPGRSVTSVDKSSTGHLIVTYDDGTTQDVGPLPTGPTCPTGYTLTTRQAPDGSGETWAVCVSPAASASVTLGPSDTPS